MEEVRQKRNKDVTNIYWKQESIPVGCALPACRPYPVVSQVPCPGGYPHQDIPTPWTYLLPRKGAGTRHTHPPERTWDKRYPPWTDRRLWKHYLPATSFTGGNKNNQITHIVKYAIWGEIYYCHYNCHYCCWSDFQADWELRVHPVGGYIKHISTIRG